MGRLTALEVLSLKQNKLSGTLDSSFVSLTSLKLLDLEGKYAEVRLEGQVRKVKDFWRWKLPIPTLAFPKNKLSGCINSLATLPRLIEM